MASSEILLESGTNEIEIMEFTIHGELYGINVVKVREIMQAGPVKPIPHSHSAVEGIFKPRDILLTVVDLPFYLTGIKTEPQPKDLFIITNFNKVNIAFRVNTVDGISRMSWTDIQKPDRTLSYGDEGVATGIAKFQDRLVTILDFEKIVAEIAPETGIKLTEVDALGDRDYQEEAILLAEDSILLSKMVETALVRSGYHNLKKFNNGKELWDYLCGIKDGDHLSEEVDLIITDIEMPQMDGHRLTKLVKEDPVFRKIPLVIFSSLINEEMERKGKELGADAQLSKPEIGHLIGIVDELILRNKKEN